ncbi:MAG: winged helix-turn-helix domain-containing protein [Halobacteria archaeon]
MGDSRPGPAPLPPRLKQLLVYLFAGTRGAEMRARIVFLLAERPQNTNQLAEALGVDYKAVQHHLKVLQKSGLIQTPQPDAYGALWFLTPDMEAGLPYLRGIWKQYGKTEIKEPEESHGP